MEIPNVPDQGDWLRDFARLALRVDRHIAGASGGTALIYQGPSAWREEVAAEDLVPPERLAEDCDELARTVPAGGHRGACLTAQLTSMRAMAEQLGGTEVPFTEHASQCLGLRVEREPEDTFALAHDRLDEALPSGQGSLAGRLHEWQAAHTVPRERLTGFADLAVTETLRRGGEILPLPGDAHADVVLDSGPHRGHYAGKHRGVIYLNDSLAFNGADLFYVVAHEGFPGHIAESLLKERLIAEQPEHGIRFMVSPQFVVSEGIGLHAQSMIFPGDEAQRWIIDKVLRPLGIASDGGDFAAIHEARNALWGAWGNAAILASEGRRKEEIADYLTKWALVTEAEAAWALDFVRTPGMGVYVLGYFHGWRLLRSWLDGPRRGERIRTLLTRPALPSDFAVPDR